MVSKRQRETVLRLGACVVIAALMLCFAGNAHAQNQSSGQPAPAPTPVFGYDIINVTEFRKVFWDAELEFNTNYEKFTEGMFIVKSVKNPDEAIGALTSENPDFRDITKMLDVSSWNLSNVFIGVTIGRFLLEFAQIFLAILSAMLAIGHRLFAPYAATGLEIFGLKYGTAVQRQAGEARIEGQYQADVARALTGREANNALSRAQQILGLHSASANRSQALGAIAGGYAMSTQMAEAQRQATTGLLEQARRQQVTGHLADRSFGQQQTNISMRREEYDLRLSQAERNVTTLANRSMDTLEHGAGAIAGIAGESMPILPAFRDGAKAITAPARAYNEIMINNTTTDARVDYLRNARGYHMENYEFTGQMRIDAAEHYAKEAGKIANTQAAANIAAARAQRDLSAGGVERGYRQQTQGINSAFRLNLEANQLNFAGAMKAAELMQVSGMKAVKLEQMSQIVTTLSRDMARRAELALTMRY